MLLSDESEKRADLKEVHVKSYTRQDGTRVRSHYRDLEIESERNVEGIDSWEKIVAAGAEVQDAYNKFCHAVGAAIGAPMFEPGGDEAARDAAMDAVSAVRIVSPKGEKRAREKFEHEHGGNWRSLKDYLRSSLVVKDARGMRDAIKTVKRVAREHGFRVSRIKNKWDRPNLDLMYGDIMLNIQASNGLQTEMQVIPSAMAAAKREGHAYNAEHRTLKAKVKAERRKSKQSDRARLDVLEGLQKDLYIQARSNSGEPWKGRIL